jgi:protein-tyrosine phosphatase
MPSVLFVCTANRFRSPIAAAWFQHRLEQEVDTQDWRVGSAGTWAEPGLSVFPSANWVNNHFGINLDAHRAIRLDRELLTQYDLILVMENSHQEALRAEFPEFKDRIFLLTEVAAGLAYDVLDPGVMQDDTFLDVAQELTDLIDKGFKEICILAHRMHRIK